MGCKENTIVVQKYSRLLSVCQVSVKCLLRACQVPVECLSSVCQVTVKCLSSVCQVTVKWVRYTHLLKYNSSDIAVKYVDYNGVQS